MRPFRATRKQTFPWIFSQAFAGQRDPNPGVVDALKLTESDQEDPE